jgi:SpoVK/Ycf46/Vps4 family AAA+-type ATPase
MSRRNPFRPPRHFLKELRRRPRVYRRVPEEYRAQSALWILRMLVLTKADPEELLEEDWFRRTVGLAVPSNQDLKGSKAIRVLGEKLAEMESRPLRRDGLLYTNIDRLSELVGLTAVDKEVLAFAVLLHTQAGLRECAGFFEDLTASTAKEVLAEVLDLDRTEVRRALKEDSTLCSAGIVRLDHTETDLVGILDLLDGLDAALLGEAADSRAMFQTYFAPALPSSLTQADFPHLQEDFSLLQDILAKAIEQGLKGVNILIHGETGTGKTEFAKVLAASLGVQLLEISHENEDSDLEEKHGRFRSYLLAQKVLARKQDSVIIFDEVEDVFPDSVLQFFGRARHSGRYKAWTNAVLESNPRPALWLCNEIYQIDPAFRRRFTYALHVRTPVRSVRRGIVVKHLGSLPASQEWIEKIAANQELTPAMIEQACKVATLAGETDPASLERLMERVLKGGLEVMGLLPELKNPHHFSVTRYSLDFLNPSQDLVELTQGLKQKPAGRICLYGPPGSGKTAFAHYLAEQVDKPLLHKKASDLLSCWVGENEKNLARMFREAKEENALLLLDEADSFLQDRRDAQHSWEVTKVNELLVQMEAFDGLFICSTNLMDSLDQAVLRRFDLKIQFGYLKPGQAWKMFVLALTGTESDNPAPRVPESVRARLARLANLTPGDFATVIRQGRVLGKQYDAEELLGALEEECRAKAKQSRPVRGFMA